MPNIFVSTRADSARALPVLAAGVILAGMLAAPAAAQAHCGGEYAVEPGDTLTAIAERCDSTVGGLVRANAQVSNPNVILVGWRLTIPEALGHDARGPGDGEPEEPVDGRAEERAEAPAPPPPDEPGLVRLAGRVAEGPECPVLRTADGEIYSLVGAMEFPVGAHVEITGRTVAMSFCMRGTTVEVISLRETAAPGGQ